MPKPRLTFTEKIDKATARGHVALNKAHATRKTLRRVTEPGDPDRQQELSYALARINGAMDEIRSKIGQLPYYDHKASSAEALRAISQALQYERRQLKKMARPA
jgi:hypothetical protein